MVHGGSSVILGAQQIMRLIVRCVLRACFFGVLVCSTAGAVEPQEGRIGPNDWPWWRGPSRDGVARGTEAPVKWSATTNVVWKATVPGRGHSSPTVIGSLVVMQTSDEQAKTQSVVAFDRKTGAKRWETTVNSGVRTP